MISGDVKRMGVRLLKPGAETREIAYEVPKLGGSINIFACLLDRALGECIIKNVICAGIKFHYDDAHLIMYYKNDRPYKRDIFALNPYIDTVVEVGEESVLPVEYFYPNADRRLLAGDQDFIDRGLALPDLFITPSMMQTSTLYRCEYVPYLRVPTDRRPALDDRLVELGLDPNKWFCCIFYREPGYEYRPESPYRDVGPDSFIALTEWIIREAGGQVVRIGHPGMSKFPQQPGFVDLAALDDGFMLQANAVARARFALMTSSGPGHLGAALGTPQAICNAYGLMGILRPDDLTLPKELRGPDGRLFDIEQGLEDGSWSEASVRRMILEEGFQAIENSPEELIELAKMMMKRSEDVQAWRPTRDIKSELLALKPPNEYRIPEPFKQSVSVVRFPHLVQR
jgi:putative glycosyltransferase (TIGR04372 family)